MTFLSDANFVISVLSAKCGPFPRGCHTTCMTSDGETKAEPTWFDTGADRKRTEKS